MDRGRKPWRGRAGGARRGRAASRSSPILTEESGKDAGWHPRSRAVEGIDFMEVTPESEESIISI
jgi:hypothetical protein